MSKDKEQQEGIRHRSHRHIETNRSLTIPAVRLATVLTRDARHVCDGLLGALPGASMITHDAPRLRLLKAPHPRVIGSPTDIERHVTAGGVQCCGHVARGLGTSLVIRTGAPTPVLFDLAVGPGAQLMLSKCAHTGSPLTQSTSQDANALASSSQ